MDLSNDGPNSRRARAIKSAALGKLMAVTPRGDKLEDTLQTYLDAAKHFSPEIFGAACEILTGTWTDTYRSPAPGNVCSMCRRLETQSRAEVNRGIDSARIALAKRNQMTVEQARAEIERLLGLPYGTDPYPPPVPDNMTAEFFNRVIAKTIDRLERFTKGENINEI